MTLAGAPHLELVCRRCTRAATFYGTAKATACEAITAGWRMTNAATNEFSCPKCSHVVEPRRSMIYSPEVIRGADGTLETA